MFTYLHTNTFSYKQTIVKKTNKPQFTTKPYFICELKMKYTIEQKCIVQVIKTH